jgi:hypothetical protein
MAGRLWKINGLSPSKLAVTGGIRFGLPNRASRDHRGASRYWGAVTGVTDLDNFERAKPRKRLENKGSQRDRLCASRAPIGRTVQVHSSTIRELLLIRSN